MADVEKRRIMVVDDEEDFLKVIKLNLEETNRYKVMTLPNAQDIIPKIYSFKPDLILLDILMPGVDGLEACEALNKDSLGASIPIIILSALDRDKDKLRAYKLGIVDYIVKPIGRTAIIAKIEKALESKERKV